MADLIKKIKIKKQDGTFTDYIPIGAEASNISTEDGLSVENKLNKKSYYFDTVADMKAATYLKNGDMVITLGYYEANDGGNGEYKIINSNEENNNGSIHTIDNGLKAKLVIENNVYNVRQWGAYGDNLHDDAPAIRNCINYLPVSDWTLYFPEGLYLQGDGTNPRYPLDESGHYSGDPDIGTPIYFQFNEKTNFKIIGNNATVVSHPNNSCIQNNRGFEFIKCSHCIIDGINYNGNIESRHPDGGDMGRWNNQSAFISKGCNDITFKNIDASYSAMDGFIISFSSDRVPTTNCKLFNCKANYNYRQGLSVVTADYGLVQNCEFNYTGTIYGTAPRFGVDLEDGYFSGQTEWTFKDCSFIGNAGGGLDIHADTSNIIIDTCYFENSTSNLDAHNHTIKDINRIVKNCHLIGGSIGFEGCGIQFKNNIVDFNNKKGFNLYEKLSESKDFFNIGSIPRNIIKENIFTWNWNPEDLESSNNMISTTNHLFINSGSAIIEDNLLINPTGPYLIWTYSQCYKLINNEIRCSKTNFPEGVTEWGTPNGSGWKAKIMYGNRIFGAYSTADDSGADIYNYTETAVTYVDKLSHADTIGPNGSKILDLIIPIKGIGGRAFNILFTYGQTQILLNSGRYAGNTKYQRNTTELRDNNLALFFSPVIVDNENQRFIIHIKSNATSYTYYNLKAELILTNKNSAPNETKKEMKFELRDKVASDDTYTYINPFLAENKNYTTLPDSNIFTFQDGDTCLYQGKPIWYYNNNWIDATGTVIN